MISQPSQRLIKWADNMGYSTTNGDLYEIINQISKLETQYDKLVDEVDRVRKLAKSIQKIIEGDDAAEFLEEISLVDKLDCLPENLPLEKDSGRWQFFSDYQEPVFVQRISETTECFIDRVLLEICEGAIGEAKKEVVLTNLSCVRV